MNFLVGIARDPHEIRSADQIAEDLTRAKNMAKKAVQRNPAWRVSDRDIQAPAMDNLPKRENLRGTHAGRLWPLPPGAAECGWVVGRYRRRNKSISAIVVEKPLISGVP